MGIMVDEPRVIEGKLGMPGLFQLHDQHGLALAGSIRLCRENGAIPGLPEFCCDAIDAGWQCDMIMRVLREGLIDSGLYSTTGIDGVLPRLQAIAWRHAVAALQEKPDD